MIGHAYMTPSPHGFVVFTTSCKNGVVIDAICDYVLHDCIKLQKPHFKFLIIIFNLLLPHGI
jgi:hypothetical protein